jgi:hypothetical protein
VENVKYSFQGLCTPQVISSLLRLRMMVGIKWWVSNGGYQMVGSNGGIKWWDSMMVRIRGERPRFDSLTPPTGMP